MKAPQILSYSTYVDSDNNFHVVGEVKNTLLSNIVNVKITATFYNDQNKVIGIGYTYTDIDILKPDQKAPFDLDTNTDPASFELTVDYQATQSQPFQGLVILDHTASISKGYHEIVGNVKNNGPRQSTLIKIICTYYDSAGTVIGKSYAYTNPENISMGDTAPFKLSSYPRKINPSSYQLQVQGQ